MAAFPSAAQAARIYDRIGSLQDTQAFYENPALEILLRHGNFGDARGVYEAGCGTGRVAARLLRDVLKPGCRYLAVDVSPRMTALTRARTAQWASAGVVRADVTSYRPEQRFDRILSLFVVDLMDDVSISGFLQCAYEALTDDGLLCVAGLAEGRIGVARTISEVWKRLHDAAPALVGGCRPGSVARHLDPERWNVRHREWNCAYGVCSEAAVASKVP